MSYKTIWYGMNKTQEIKSILPQGHPNIPKEKVGVLLINLGTPGCDRFLVDKALLKRVSFRSPCNRSKPNSLETDSKSHNIKCQA